MRKKLNFTLYFCRKKLSFNVASKFYMIHQNKCFVCPEQNYGISWNICLGRQGRDFEGCQNCTYKDWQNNGELSFDPYVASFKEGEELPDIEDEQFRSPDPRKVPVYSAEPRSFLPSDVGLEDKKSKKRNWIRVLYDAI